MDSQKDYSKLIQFIFHGAHTVDILALPIQTILISTINLRICDIFDDVVENIAYFMSESVGGIDTFVLGIGIFLDILVEGVLVLDGPC